MRLCLVLRCFRLLCIWSTHLCLSGCVNSCNLFGGNLHCSVEVLSTKLMKFFAFIFTQKFCYEPVRNPRLQQRNAVPRSTSFVDRGRREERLRRIVTCIGPNQKNQHNLDLYLARRYKICQCPLVVSYPCIGQNQKNQPNMVLYLVRRYKIFVSVATLLERLH